ncbi:MAG: helix-turn-helix domain-containing protein [Albidovulum sp.]|nr:helix-turn-helix domain-containing protein [Albidovulum sp.]
MPKAEFRLGAFRAALDSVRLARGLTWKSVADQSGVSASTLTRLSQGKRPDVDSLSALIQWSGLTADDFMPPDRSTEPPEPLAEITSVVYSDKSLSTGDRDAMIDIIRATYLRLRDRDSTTD